VTVFHHFLGRLALSRSARNSHAPASARAIFEERYQDELFLADELMSRGGAISSEDHVWLRKLMTAYEASSLSPGDAAAADAIPDPWAQETQPGVFGGQGVDHLVDSGGSGGDAHDPIGEARKLREESARSRQSLRSELARLAGEREQLRRALDRMWEFVRDRPIGVWLRPRANVEPSDADDADTTSGQDQPKSRRAL